MTRASGSSNAPVPVWEVASRAVELAGSDERVLFGITGPPAAGKSTLARALVDHVGEAARLVGMDGFHLAQARLAELGRLSRKGAPDTFDAVGFVSLVRRLANPGKEIVYAPEFRRDSDESVAGAVAIEPHVRLVVIEGNYLLVPDKPWGELGELFHEIWYCERNEDDRRTNLIERHRTYGRSDREARDWALGPDERNAALVRTTRSRADHIVIIDGHLDLARPGDRPERESRASAS